MIVRLKIDVSKIVKEHIFEGKKGKYIDCDLFLNDEKDQFGNNGSIKQSWKNGENYEGVYIGNAKTVKR